MVCLPCFVIPAVLFIFRMFLQPLVFKIWGRYMQEPALSCPMPKKKVVTSTTENASTSVEADTSPAQTSCSSGKEKSE